MQMIRLPIICGSVLISALCCACNDDGISGLEVDNVKHFPRHITWSYSEQLSVTVIYLDQQAAEQLFGDLHVCLPVNLFDEGSIGFEPAIAVYGPRNEVIDRTDLALEPIQLRFLPYDDLPSNKEIAVVHAKEATKIAFEIPYTEQCEKTGTSMMDLESDASIKRHRFAVQLID